MTNITLELAYRDDCLSLLVPSDLRKLVEERDQLRMQLDAQALTSSMWLPFDRKRPPSGLNQFMLRQMNWYANADFPQYRTVIGRIQYTLHGQLILEVLSDDHNLEFTESIHSYAPLRPHPPAAPSVEAAPKFTAQTLESSTWASTFPKEDAAVVQRALALAVSPHLRVSIQQASGPQGMRTWNIIAVNLEPGLWLSAHETYHQARSLCREMGWSIQSIPAPV